MVAVYKDLLLNKKQDLSPTNPVVKADMVQPHVENGHELHYHVDSQRPTQWRI